MLSRSVCRIFAPGVQRLAARRIHTAFPSQGLWARRVAVGATAAAATAVTAYGLQTNRTGRAAHCATSAKDLVAQLSKGLPRSRDLTSRAEARQCLDLASQILASGVPIDEVKKVCYADPTHTSAVLLSAVKSAESKLNIQACGDLHLTCVFAMHNEHNRILPGSEHKHGQDFIRVKVEQLRWLFDGEKGKTWDIVAVDDGCPNNSIGLARKVVEAEGYKDVHLLHLQQAIDQRIPFFVKGRHLLSTGASRKGGALLFGLRQAAEMPVNMGEKAQRLIMVTDSDLSHDLSYCGSLTAGIMVDGCPISMGARYGVPDSFIVDDKCALPHPQNHFAQPNMMKITFRYFTRSRLLPMVKGLYDIPTAFKCFKCDDILGITEEVFCLGREFDTELLICALQYYQQKGIPNDKLCKVFGTLYKEDFHESNFELVKEDPDFAFRQFEQHMRNQIAMHIQHIPADSKDAKDAAALLAFLESLTSQGYKTMIQSLRQDLGPVLIDYDFTLPQLKSAARKQLSGWFRRREFPKYRDQ